MDDTSVRVFKGYGLSKEADEYLSSHGLKNAIYSIDASEAQNDRFGQLITCPFRVRFWTCVQVNDFYAQILFKTWLYFMHLTTLSMPSKCYSSVNGVITGNTYNIY